MIYFDTSYIVRLYFDDPGAEAVRRLAATATVACGSLGRAETVAALYRKLRDGALSRKRFETLMSEFRSDSGSGAFRWLPLSEAVFERVDRTFSDLPANIFLRASDAVHLGCAAENGLREIYTNDVNLLTSASYFGLHAVNVVTP